MRISTSTIFDGGGARLSELQAQIDRTGKQIASGRKVLTPADDPVAAARALEVQQSAAINEQYAKNRLNLKNALGVMDGSLSSMVDTLQGMHEQLIAAGNATYSASDRAAIGKVLQGQPWATARTAPDTTCSPDCKAARRPSPPMPAAASSATRGMAARSNRCRSTARARWRSMSWARPCSRPPISSSR